MSLEQAIRRRSEARDKILENLGTVPDVIADAQQKQKRFPKDVTLFSRTSELYDALFKAIPSLIEILNRDSNEPRKLRGRYSSPTFLQRHQVRLM